MGCGQVCSVPGVFPSKVRQNLRPQGLRQGSDTVTLFEVSLYCLSKLVCSAEFSLELPFIKFVDY